MNIEEGLKGSGAGMSRAAKKRAKKSKKKFDAAKQFLSGSTDHADGSSIAQSSIPNQKKPRLDDPELDKPKKSAPIPRKPTPGENVVFDESDGDENNVTMTNEAKEKEASTTVLDSSDSYIPSVPNTSLTEILMLDPVKDEEKSKLISSLPACHRATCLFQAILEPMSLDEFYKEYWEKKPLIIKGKGSKRFRNLLSLQSIREMTKKNKLFYARDLNVTKYKKGKDGVKRRATLDKVADDGEDPIQVDNTELWSDFKNGCTIRLLCPHKHSDNIHALLSTLELELQCMVGANAYLTPPGSSQGFAPHYDDIEAFCLQLEGSKRWKVYEPTLKLPRASSEDFVASDLEGKTPVIDVTLEEGDLLYMPRGWIHQACTLQDEKLHSLHLTISAMQQWAWADLIEMILPEALENAILDESSTTLRQGLPKGFLDYMGAMYEEPSDEKLPESLKKVDEDDEEKKLRRILQDKFRADAKKRIMKVAKAAYEMVDVGCDQLAKRFMSDRQPFALTSSEKAQTCKSQEFDLLPDTLCRLVRPGIARLVIEDNIAVVYHCGDNSREYQGNPLSPLEYEMDDGPAIEQLLTTVEPHWIFVNDLFHDTVEDKIAIAQSLYDEGILAVRQQEESS